MSETQLDEKDPLIWVVDDEVDLAAMMSWLLESEGFRVKYFSDSREALAELEDFKIAPEVLITDGQMPQLNGLELIEYCRQLVPGIKTILVSGSFSLDDIAANKCAPDVFFKKPFNFDKLILAIKELLQEESATEQNWNLKSDSTHHKSPPSVADEQRKN